MKKRNKGFSLVVVLALTAVASAVVFTSLRDTVVQERLGGNFQKSLNARMLSERAAYEQVERIKAFLAANPNASIEELTDGISDIENNSQHATDLRYTASLTESSGDLVIEGYGERYSGDAIANLFFNFGFQSGGSNSPFNTAIVGCEGVANQAGSVIDSYDSNLNDGIFLQSNVTSQADVRTIVQDSDILLTGGSTTLGDLLATGSITINGSAFVGGSIRANDDITITGGVGAVPSGFPSSTRVGGNVETQGDISYQGGFIQGVVRAEGDVRFTPSYAVVDSNNTGFPVLYGGNINSNASDQLSGNNYNDSQFQSTSLDVAEVPFSDPNNTDPDLDTTNPETNCDPLSIAAAVEELTDAISTDEGVNITSRSTPAFFTPTSGSHGSASYSPLSANVFGIDFSSVYYLDQLNINGGAITISGGDVAIYVEGDFSFTTNGNSELIIEDGSSLTLIVSGVSTISNEATVTRAQITDTGLPPFSLFSAHEAVQPATNCFGNNGFGVIINATGNTYAAVYAPLTNISIRASGELFGSVRGRTVQLCGSGDIHYDTALLDSTVGSGSNANSQLVFQGLQFNSGN